MVFFTSQFLAPPGGEYFFECDGESFRTPSYSEAVRRVADIMRRKGKPSRPPEAVLAEYMCPHMPDGFCTRQYGNKTFTLEQMKEDAKRYFNLPLVPFDEVERRLSVCTQCPRHSRTFCLTCVGAVDWIRRGFGGARRILPVDAYTGACQCAGTFAAVVASVEETSLPPWTHATKPNTCWRKS